MSDTTGLESVSAETGMPPSVPRWVWGAGIALTVLVLGGAAAVVALDARMNNSGTVRATAERYIQAVADGDAEEANELSGMDSGSGPMLDSDVLAEAEHISNVELRDFRVDFDRGRASGDVEFELQGERFTDRIELLRDDDEQWTVGSGLQYTVMYSSPFGDVLSLEGLDEAIPADGEVRAYAGAYDIVSTSEYLDPVGGSALRVTPELSYFDAWEWFEPNAEYTKEAQRRVTEWYEDCASETTVDALRQCGIEVDDSDVRVSGRAEAEVEMLETPKLWEEHVASGWTEIDDVGDFAVTLRGQDTSGEPFTAEVSGWAAEAEVEIRIDGGELLVEVYPY